MADGCEAKRKDDQIKEKKKKIEQLEKQVKELQAKENQSAEKIKALEEEIVKLKKEIEELKDSYTWLEKDLKTTKEELKTTKQTLKDHDQRIKGFELSEDQICIAQLCTSLQKNICKIVLGDKFDDNLNHNPKYVDDHIRNLIEDEDERKAARERWENLKREIDWDPYWITTLKPIKDERNKYAHRTPTEKNVKDAKDNLKMKGKLTQGMTKAVDMITKMWKQTNNKLSHGKNVVQSQPTVRSTMGTALPKVESSYQTRTYDNKVYCVVAAVAEDPNCQGFGGVVRDEPLPHTQGRSTMNTLQNIEGTGQRRTSYAKKVTEGAHYQSAPVKQLPYIEGRSTSYQELKGSGQPGGIGVVRQHNFNKRPDSGYWSYRR